MTTKQRRGVQRYFCGLLAACFLWLCGCQPHTSPDLPADNTDKEYPVFVGSFTLTKAPQRVVILSPLIAGWVDQLDLGDTVIGCVTEGDPASFSRASDIGSALSPNWEAIASLQPDFILTQTLYGDAKTFVEQNHLPCLALDSAASLSELNSRYHTLATALIGAISGAQRAQSCYTALTERLQAVADTVGTPEVSITAVLVTTRYGHVATGDTLLHELMTYAGAINVAKDGTHWQLPQNSGTIQVLFCPAAFQPDVTATVPFSHSSAVKNQRVYAIEEDLLTQQGDNLVLLTEQMARVLYPSRFDADVSQTADRT